MVGANCACGLFHPSNTQCSFSMFWGSTPQYMQPSPNNYQTTKPAASYQYDEPTENYYSSSDYYYAAAAAAAAAATASPPSSVDCTLSLGTPSTRLSNAGGDAGHGRSSNDHQQQHRPRRSVSNFCWDLLHPNKSSSKSSANTHHNTSSSQPAVAADPLVARRCANCDTTSTPLWRNGPRGPKSLCNACGIRYKKEERRAAANNSTNNHHASAAQATAGAGINMSIDANGYYGTTAASPWTAAAAHHHQSQKIQCFSHAAAAAAAMGNEFRLIEDHDTRDSFLSWRLNVMHG